MTWRSPYYEAGGNMPGKTKHRNTLRNRKIYAAFLAGQTAEELAKTYKLHIATMKHILNAERLKHAVSKEQFYRDRRSQEAAQPSCETVEQS